MKNRKNLDQAEPLLNNCSEFWNNLFKTNYCNMIQIATTDFGNTLVLKQQDLLRYFYTNFVNHVEKSRQILLFLNKSIAKLSLLD